MSWVFFGAFCQVGSFHSTFRARYNTLKVVMLFNLPGLFQLFIIFQLSASCQKEPVGQVIQATPLHKSTLSYGDRIHPQPLT